MQHEASTTFSQPLSVIVTSETLCEVHGWTPGKSYPVLNRPVEQPDANGFDIWIASSTRGRAVKLSSSEYKFFVFQSVPSAAPFHYRAWDALNEVMLYLGKGNADTLEINSDFWALGERHYDEIIGAKSYNTGSALMLSIGISDKNGVAIFAGDIVQVKAEDGQINTFSVQYGLHRRRMWSSNTVDIPGFAFVSSLDDSRVFPIAGNYLGGHDLEIMQVVGNIYENPELIGK